MVDRYVPESFSEVQPALDDGVLVEGPHLDFKQELGSGKGANKNFAKDLASFAVAGGTIIIGVAEPDDAPASLHPVELHGLKERVDQIARSNIDPPLDLTCTELPDPSEPSRGCLVVSVPPSADAPHQVDGRYWRRGDTTNYQMTDAEVRGLIEQRVRSRPQTDALLDQEIKRCPVPPEMRENGYLYGVAQPVLGDDALFERTLDDRNFSSWIHEVMFRQMRDHGASRPDLLRPGTTSSRAHGWAVHSNAITRSRGIDRDFSNVEDQAVDLEIRYDGGVRVFHGRAVAPLRDGPRVLVDPVVAVATQRLVEAAAVVAEETGYRGDWTLGIAITDLKGVASNRALRQLLGSETPYSAEEYRRSALVTHADFDDPVRIVDRLTSRLFRSLRSPFNVDDLR